MRTAISQEFRLPFGKRSAVLALASLLLVTGCNSIKVGLGTRIALDKIPVASIEATLPNGPAIAPGEKSPLLVVITSPDGKKLQTEGAGHGEIMWKDLVVSASVVRADRKGNLSLPSDPRYSEDKMPHVTITVPSHPELRAELDVPVRYDYFYKATFSGKPGTIGTSGLDGRDGMSGSMGSIDPNNPQAGGDGSNGTDGADGQDGGPGGDGPPVEVLVTPRPGKPGLLEVGVSAGGKEKLFLLNPDGGSLLIRSDGGRGGSGGSGGRGGRGGSGGTGLPSGNSGRDGMAGRSGSDGPPGKGGRITVIYDPQTGAFLSAILVSNENGPAPVFRERPMAPLW